MLKNNPISGPLIAWTVRVASLLPACACSTMSPGAPSACVPQVRVACESAKIVSTTVPQFVPRAGSLDPVITTLCAVAVPLLMTSICQVNPSFASTVSGAMITAVTLAVWAKAAEAAREEEREERES